MSISCPDIHLFLTLPLSPLKRNLKVIRLISSNDGYIRKTTWCIVLVVLVSADYLQAESVCVMNISLNVFYRSSLVAHI